VGCNELTLLIAQKSVHAAGLKYERSPNNNLSAAHVLLRAGACIPHHLSKNVPGDSESCI
jgi:hypothetical protein